MPDTDRPDAQKEARIAELRRRWQERPSPRAGLQLTEELRRSGRLTEAQEVLERSLDENPGHLSSLVALGKTRLELADAAGAVRNFEQVVDRDPTHLVANKLLIEAYLLHGDPAAAGARLEHYRLLNAGDEELESLAERIAALAEEQTAAEAPEEAPSDEAGERASEEPPEGGTPEPAEPASAAAVHRAGAAGGEPPFPLLGSGDKHRYLEGLRSAGIFPLSPEPPAPESPQPEPAESETPEPETAEPEVARPGKRERQLFELEDVEPEPFELWPAAASPPAPEMPAAAASEAEAPAAEAAAEEAAEKTDVEPQTAEAETEADAVVEELELPRRERTRATSTLGELYLAQGHLEEAERVFREVLEADPQDHSAAAGLAELLRRRQGGLSAPALLRWAEERGVVTDSDDAGERRRALLTAYGERLRSRRGEGSADAQSEETPDVP